MSLTLPGLAKSPISAFFLLKFDVKTGYTIEWSKAVKESISLKGLEFKALPSGLHHSQRDVIAFVEDQDEDTFPERLMYGVSVFKSNLDENLESRAEVRMYSLGLLIDPERYSKTFNTSNKTAAPLVWKPLIFTSGWEYIQDLENLLDKWLQVTDDDVEKYKLLEDFFNGAIQNGEKMIGDSKADDDQVSHSASSVQTTSAKYHQSHHMLLSLPSLLENFGPLIFKIWKLSLLRKRILIHNAESIELNCSFSYCISVISTIPREVLPGLISTHHENLEALQYYQPLYNVGINDISYLESIIKKLDPGFIASTTDEILLYKPTLYDYSVKLSSEKSIPEIISSSNFQKHSQYSQATQRDFRRFKILYDEFDLYRDDEYRKEDDFKWWFDVTEPTSWKEYLWKGFSWWASLGENDHSNHDFAIDKEGLDNISNFDDQDSVSTNTDTVLTSKPAPSSMSLPVNGVLNNEVSKEILDSLKIVGYFQNMTVKIFQVLIEIIQNYESDDSEDAETKNDIIYVSLNDINEMGLDPYSSQDHQFIIELIKVWWGKDATVGNYVGNLCC